MKLTLAWGTQEENRWELNSEEAGEITTAFHDFLNRCSSVIPRIEAVTIRTYHMCYPPIRIMEIKVVWRELFSGTKDPVTIQKSKNPSCGRKDLATLAVETLKHILSDIAEEVRRTHKEQLATTLIIAEDLSKIRIT